MLDLTQSAAPLLLQLPAFTRVNLTLVGCGGTGSHIASGLISLKLALDDKGIACNIQLVDADTVEQKNVGRQLFSMGDIGKPKAAVIANRLMSAYGIPISATNRMIDVRDTFTMPGCFNVVIGAVDNPAAREMISKQVKAAKGALWWLDCGNERHSGQVAVGNACSISDVLGSVALGLVDRLPAPHVVYPDLVATPKAKPKRTTRQSCAELTASGEQGLMVNRMVAAWATAMLNDLLIARDLKYFSLAFDLRWGGCKAHAIDLPTLQALKPRREVKRG